MSLNKGSDDATKTTQAVLEEAKGAASTPAPAPDGGSAQAITAEAMRKTRELERKGKYGK